MHVICHIVPIVGRKQPPEVYEKVNWSQTVSSSHKISRMYTIYILLNDAAALFQHDIQTVIQRVAGAIYINDDIAIFGVVQCAHDNALNEVLH